VTFLTVAPFPAWILRPLTPNGRSLGGGCAPLLLIRCLIIALVVLAPVGFRVPALALAVAATLIVILLAAWDSVAYRRRRARSPREAAA
jgi:hypothetical protein